MNHAVMCSSARRHAPACTQHGSDLGGRVCAGVCEREREREKRERKEGAGGREELGRVENVKEGVHRCRRRGGR